MSYRNNQGYNLEESSGSRKHKYEESQDGQRGGLAPVVAKHYNEIEEKGVAAREESRIFHMRSFNNWIKSMLIRDMIDRQKELGTHQCTVLDMCCGKGGDIQKWLKSNSVDHVVFADIAETSVEHCRERYNGVARGQQRNSNYNNPNKRFRSNMFTAQFITADCTKESLGEKYDDPNIGFDIVSIQFSFHYSFETISQAMKMLENVSQNLKTGGVFIGTLPDANEIVKRSRLAENKEYGNDVFRVKLETEEPYPEFGAKYFFQLEERVNCPEFLVHFPILEALAAKFGLKLLFRYTFPDYFERKKEDGFGLLTRMKALEAYSRFPERRSPNQVVNKSEYSHAEEFLRRNQNEREVLTLSKSEWDAISLYLVFAFEKTADYEL